ncbi:MAG: M14 family metallopeptidase [Lachnospiraceae bacterium]
MKISNCTKLRLGDNLSWQQKKMAVQSALILGFQAEAAEFPVVSAENGIDVPETVESLLQLLNYLDEDWERPQDYIAASDNAKPIADFDWRVKKGLESLFTTGEFLRDNNLDLLPDQLDFKLIMDPDCSTSVLTAACNFAFRFGMETTTFNDWLAAPEYSGGNALLFSDSGYCRIRMEEKDGSQRIYVDGSGKELEEFSARFCEEFPGLSHFDTWSGCLREMTDSFAMRSLDGQLAHLATCQDAEKELRAYVSPEIDHCLGEVQSHYPGVDFQNFKGMKPVYQKEYSIPWEVEVFRDLLEEKVYPRIKPGDRIEISAALSEEQDIRAELKETVRAKLEQYQAEADDITILCAYKQGLSWIDEVVIPKLETQPQATAVRVAFRPFLPEGITEWGDEDGATPTYHNTGENPDRWYDLPIRYLQELYPVEDILVKRMSIQPNQIEFVLYEGKKDITYEFTALDSDRQVIYQSDYRAECSERPYLDAFPEMGVVHPATGYIKVKLNGKVILDQRIKTDVEMIWDIYQSEVLNDCRTFIEHKLNGDIRAEDQPYFARLCLEVTASEPDYRLDSREDMVSTLDALHEDMYFTGADYFKNYGKRKIGVMLEEPGLILPVIRKGSGGPKFKVTLYDQQAAEPAIYNGTEQIRGILSREHISLYLSEVSYQNQKWYVTIHTKGVDVKTAAAYMKLLEQGMVLKKWQLSGVGMIILKVEEESFQAVIARTDRKETALEITQIDLMEERLIGYEEYLEIISQLRRVPGLAVYQTAESYLGREVYAIELLPPSSGYVSRTKRITNHPSQIINCRHHANEVSSTNAAFILLKRLLTDESLSAVPERLNLVIVPMENPDGAAIHYELQKDNPYWKLHVARFNAVGKEFYHEHFKSDTKHSEALGLTRLFRTFVPDIIVDNHGVPSHEWDQQFSGYTSPSFKGFWLPRSLLYGYFWVVSDAQYKSNMDVNKKLEDVIAEAVGDNPEMKRWNQEWARQFEKYAHQWMPKLFPAEYYKEMINYWIPFTQDSAHRYPSIRFPWITTVAYTSEVADETAQGSYLNLCARAHVTHDIATIKMLINAQCIYENRFVLTAQKADICHTRQRPIIV